MLQNQGQLLWFFPCCTKTGKLSNISVRFLVLMIEHPKAHPASRQSLLSIPSLMAGTVTIYTYVPITILSIITNSLI